VPCHVSGSIAGLRGPLLLRAAFHGRGSAALGAALLPSGSSLYGWVRKLMKVINYTKWNKILDLTSLQKNTCILFFT
jgi:hypothetical protein